MPFAVEQMVYMRGAVQIYDLSRVCIVINASYANTQIIT